MPICEADPWRLQYFENVACPPDVLISTEDTDSWTWYPRHRWVYDKVLVAQSQGLAAAPHGVEPPAFPVFSKPITNLKGMGVGSRVLRSAADYATHYAPGHMWMTLLDGRHVSSDVAVVDGEPVWWRHVTGRPIAEGTFDYWMIHAAPDAAIETRCGAWIRRIMAGYTGMMNLETIGGTIIEAHLRFADQWPDLYGARLGRGDRRAPPAWALGLLRRQPPRRLQRGAVRPARAALPPSAAQRSSTTSAPCHRYRACRSPSTRTARRTATPCRPAVSASRSSIATSSRPALAARERLRAHFGMQVGRAA